MIVSPKSNVYIFQNKWLKLETTCHTISTCVWHTTQSVEVAYFKISYEIVTCSIESLNKGWVDMEQGTSIAQKCSPKMSNTWVILHTIYMLKQYL